MANKFSKSVASKVLAVLRPLVAFDGNYEDDSLVSEVGAIAARYRDGARMVKRDVAIMARGVARCVAVDSTFALA